MTITAMYSLDIVSDLKAHDQEKCIGFKVWENILYTF